MSGLVSHDDAIGMVLAACRPVGAEDVPLAEAAGRVLAADVAAPAAVPPWANSAMDGFAVRSVELAGGPTALPLTAGAGAAGEAPPPLPVGHAARVATGAPIPAGADAVVPIEEAEVGDGRVRLPGGVAPGRYVRSAGSDMTAGGRALEAGTPLGPAEGALLAALGVARVRVHRRPRVAVLSTGAELVPPDAAPGPAQIRDANGTALAWACRAAGAEVVALGIAPDEAEPLRRLLARGLEADVLVTSGGVSVGARDLVREGLRALGAEERFWGIALKPGKPCTLAVRGDTLALGLPGNPASALVGLELFVRPALRARSGRTDPRPRLWPARAAGEWPAPETRAHAVRCRLRAGDGTIEAVPTGDQGSHRIASLVGADALALLGPGRRVAPGDHVAVMRTGRS